jgi:hypothetical protein
MSPVVLPQTQNEMHSHQLILILSLCAHLNCIAQSSGFGTIPSDGGRYVEHTDRSSLPDSIYRFLSFEYGRITLATGFSPDEQLRFNYNLFTGEVDMINSKGDTVTVQRMKELKFISMADHLFLHSYKDGYIEVLSRSVVSLGVLNLIVADYRNDTVHPYIQGNEGARSDPYYYKTQGFYFFLDKDHNAYKASSSAIRKLFYDYKKKVKAYINEKDIDFNNREHLITLLTYCNDISAQSGK